VAGHDDTGPTSEHAVASASAIDRYLDTARAGLDRVAPEGLAAEVATGALVVDIRPAADREAEGTYPGAVVIERIHLEWRLDPTSPHRIAEATDGRRVIVMCNEGYASSLAAAVLRDLGVDRATDLAGGYRAWAAQVAGGDPPPPSDAR
jgi:rhodanese-related sulfurtransferase